MTEVVFSRVAERDLEEIGDFIAGENPVRAVTFVREIRARCEKIALAPRAAPLQEQLLPGVRMVPYGNYLIFYRVIESSVRIERILHGARNITSLLE